MIEKFAVGPWLARLGGSGSSDLRRLAHKVGSDMLHRLLFSGPIDSPEHVSDVVQAASGVLEFDILLSGMRHLVARVRDHPQRVLDHSVAFELPAEDLIPVSADQVWEVVDVDGVLYSDVLTQVAANLLSTPVIQRTCNEVFDPSAAHPLQTLGDELAHCAAIDVERGAERFLVGSMRCGHRYPLPKRDHYHMIEWEAGKTNTCGTGIATYSGKAQSKTLLFT